MKKDINKIQKARSVLDGMIEEAICKGIRISKDKKILKHSRKLNKLIAKYHKSKKEE